MMRYLVGSLDTRAYGYGLVLVRVAHDKYPFQGPTGTLPGTPRSSICAPKGAFQGANRTPWSATVGFLQGNFYRARAKYGRRHDQLTNSSLESLERVVYINQGYNARFGAVLD
eukprot:scaffold96957_cov53-Attheya_sp.AAC.1